MAGIDLGRAANLLMNGGGHAMAAGFVVDEAKLEAFVQFMQDHVRAQLTGGTMTPQLHLDGALAVSAVTHDLIEELSAVAPFGAGNEEPRFAVVDASITKADVVGNGHVRCFLSGRSGGRLKAIAFNTADSDLGHLLLTGTGRRFHVAGTLRADTWQGRTEAQLVIDDAVSCA